MSHSVVLVVLVPLGGAILASLLAGTRERATRCVVGASAALHCMAVVGIIVDTARSGGSIYQVGSWPGPLGIVLVADPLSGFFLCLLAVGHIVFFVHAVVTERTPRRSLWILTELLVAALSGMVVAGDLFNLFVFLELASVSSVGLMVHKQRAEGAGAGFVYLLFTSVSGVLFLIAVVLLYRSVGALSLRQIAIHGEQVPPAAYRAAVALLTASLGMKFGLVPFHFWQAPAYDAAGSSVAALLSGTGLKIYLYVLFRLLAHVFRAHGTPAAMSPVILLLGTINILVGHSLALAERDLKRMLAYSSVAHVGYVLVALAVVLVSDSPTVASVAASAALLHVVFHALMKTTLFYSGRALIDGRGGSTIERLRGVGRKEQIGFGAFIGAAVSIVGIPPTSGFYSKWRIALQASTSLGPVPVVVIAAGTVISTLYYGRILHVGLSEPVGPPPQRAGPSRWSLGLVAILAAACVALGVFGPYVEDAFARAASALADPGAFSVLLANGR